MKKISLVILTILSFSSFAQMKLFEYDKYNRLIKSTLDNTIIEYSYDELGNRLSKEITIVEDSVVFIPDANLKAALVENPEINSNSDNEIQYNEALAYADSIDVNSLSIADMTGIEAFTSLIYLNCENNTIDTLDVSALTQLNALYCDNNQIEFINVDGLTNLRYLLCSNNLLTTFSFQ